MLKELIEKGAILRNPEFTTKEELFCFVADDAAHKQFVTSADKLYKGLIDREEQMSTEIEKGIAIPHTKLNDINEIFVYLIISEKGIKYAGPGSRVKISFLIGAPHNSRHFIEVMAMIARLLQKKDNREALLKASDEQEILSIIDSICKVSESVEPATRNLHGLVLILNESNTMETAMNLAIELGIKGAQVFDSTNVSAKIALNFPFLSMLASKNEQISSKILFGVVESETIASRLYAHMKKEGININDAGAGILYTFPLGAIYGGIDIDYS